MRNLNDYALDLTQMTFSELQTEADRRRRLMNTYGDYKIYSQRIRKQRESKFHAHRRRYHLVRKEITQRSSPTLIRGAAPRD